MEPTTQAVIDLVFKALEIIALVMGGGMILIRMGKMAGGFEAIGRQQACEISELKSEVKGLSALITTVAVQKIELEGIRSDIERLTKWYDELRHGKGIISGG